MRETVLRSFLAPAGRADDANHIRFCYFEARQPPARPPARPLARALRPARAPLPPRHVVVLFASGLPAAANVRPVRH